MSNKRKYLLARVTAPASEPLTLAETKLYLRVDTNTDDTLIADLIVAARMAAEQYLGKSLITQSWKIAYDDYLPEMTYLPMGPVDSITDVTMVARDESTQTITSNTYYLNAAKDTLINDSILFSHRVEVVYETGYGDAEDIPQPLRYGMLAHIAAMYDARGESGITPLPEQAVRLYTPLRGVRL